MVASLVNKDNSHVGGLLSSNQGAVKGFGGKVIGSDGTCKGIKQYGGKHKNAHIRKNLKSVFISVQCVINARVRVRNIKLEKVKSIIKSTIENNIKKAESIKKRRCSS